MQIAAKAITSIKHTMSVLQPAIPIVVPNTVLAD
ncbi:hypothetical protein PssvBMR4_gp21c [Pseudomonas phage MR4]|uniref:Uncharacterized protein n=1 Tax=Pseudomonas phage MR4 TaxID=2711171 RepID=A0A6M3TAB3_9CAUD|nr:hypothetical protein PssvBMR4_gp21c [Pseudomonas phage MR4]